MPLAKRLHRPFKVALLSAALMWIALAGLRPAAYASCGGTTEATTESELNDAINDFNSQAGPCDYIIEFEEDITLTGDLTQINNSNADVSLLINGGGFTLDGDSLYQTFTTLATDEVTFEDITVTNSNNDGIRVNGGSFRITRVSILNSNSDGVEFSDGTLVLRDSTLAFNDDDGIDAYSDIVSLFVINSTITGHGDDAIFVNGGTTVLTHATVAGNFEGFYNEGSDATVNNSILADGGGDCVLDAGTIDVNFSLVENDSPFDPCGVTDGVDGNIVGEDPMLRPLGNYGGPTQTMPPVHLGGDVSIVSPAVDAGDEDLSVDENDVELDNDQRGAGFGRVVGPEADMGAVESQGAEPITCPSFPATVSDEVELGNAILCYNDISTPGVYTISVAPSIDLTASPPVIDNDTAGVSLVIEGGGQIIDGQDTPGVRPIAVGPDTTVTINALRITGGNVPNDDGGGIHNQGNLTLNTVFVEENTAGDDGGGIFNEDGAMLAINNSSVSANIATYPNGDGGGISNDGEATIIDSAVTANTAEGDFFVIGGGILNEGIMTIVRSTIANNEVEADEEEAIGGGIANQANLVIRDSTIHGNTAKGGFDDALGGGIYSEPDAEEVVDMGYGARLLIINSTISDNTAESQEDPNGGGLYVTDVGPGCCLVDPVPVTLINVTLVGNRSVGDDEVVGGGASFAQYLFGGELQVTIHNSILADNLTDGAPGGDCVLESDGGDLNFESLHSLYEDTDEGACGLAAANPDGDGNIVGVDPNLDVLANNGGPTLTHATNGDNSDVIDSGDNALALDENGDPLAADQRGYIPRVVNGTVDMGAVEYGAEPPTSDVFLSTRTAGTTGDGLNFGSEDIIVWDGSAWSMWFDGSAAGLEPKKAKHNLNAIWIPDTAGDDFIFSFAQNRRTVPGVAPKVDGMDLVLWDGSAFSFWFDGSDVALTNKTQEKIDGLHILDGSESPIGGGCLAYLLISTQGPGKVPNHSGGQLKFGGEDVLGFCATSLGENTAGLWHMVLDGSAEGMPRNSTDSISLSDDGGTMFLTTQGPFNVDAAAGGHSMVYAYDFGTGTFSGPVFNAPAEGLSDKVDGLQMN